MRSTPTPTAATSARSPRDINKIVAEYQKQLSPGNRIEVIGQIDSMNSAFRDLADRHPVRGGVRLSADGGELPDLGRSVRGHSGACRRRSAASSPCCTSPSTTLSVPSLMGAIMAIGVASANSILLVTFAREQQLAGMTRVRRGDRRRPHPYPPGADDRGGDDRRHDPDGDRRRRRGAERGAGARRDRRPAFCNADHAVRGALSVRLLRKGNDGKPAHGVFAEDPQ